MPDPADPSGVIQLLGDVVIPVLTLIVGRVWGEARAARRAFHAAKFSQEQSVAYDEVKKAFVALRANAAHSFRRLMEIEERPESRRGLTPQERAEESNRHAAARQAYLRLKEIALLGPIDLSEGAVDVVKRYVAEVESPDRSDGEGIYYEDEAWSKRYLRDFIERREVDLGQMGAVRWYLRRRRRSMQERLTRRYYRLKGWWDSKRYDRARAKREALRLKAARPLAPEGHPPAEER